MEPGSNRLPVQVLGENEALQQFFNGQDVSGVLDSSVAVDTSILEQYLSNDMDPSSFILPESPPDSSSEACSPPQIPDLRNEHTHWPTQRATPSYSCYFEDRGPSLSNPRLSTGSSSCRFKDNSHDNFMTHDQLRGLGLTNTYIKAGTPPAPQYQHTHSSSENYPPGRCLQGYTPPTPPSPSLPPSHRYLSPISDQAMVTDLPPPPTASPQDHGCTQHICPSDSKKRRRSESREHFPAADSSCYEAEGTCGGSVGSSVGGATPASSQFLSWEHYSPDQWSLVYDSSCQTLSSLAYRVDTDKGFNYSQFDEAFVCQKKNHFQVTVHIGVAAEPQFVKSSNGPQEVDHFEIKVFGIKLESPSHLVTIEQSQPDRSKRPFHPARVGLHGGKVTKVTLGRLHFSETTANNMRKKGKPNPDQRYFQMVVGLYAAVKSETVLLTALVSERIIVRASNPGQFEMDGDPVWQRGLVQESIVCQGRVGINTDSPDEALVVCGNAKVMGAIMQPSDSRAKQNIQEVDSEQQLKRITQMRIVEFDYKPEFASTVGIDHTHQTGVIAQEVKELLPSAVTEVGDVMSSDGELIQNFLMLDKEQIFMENVGAVQQLSKLTDNLETRIQELEVWNRRLAKLKSLTGSLRSTGKPQRHNSESTASISEPPKNEKVQRDGPCQKYKKYFKKRIFKAGVFTLLATVAFCVVFITTIYLLSLKGENDPGDDNQLPVQTTSPAITLIPTSRPGSWPPEVDFCELLYCDEVYCCPPPGGGGKSNNATISESTEEFEIKDFRRKRLTHHLKSAGDWRNTTIHTFMIKENKLVIDSKYCIRDECGPGRYIFRVPISQFVPLNMRVTLLMNSTELLVVHLCRLDESATCPAMLDANTVARSRYPSNTQGEHEWPLHVARLHQSSYHFRSAVAGQADCSTDHHYAGALFTDYHFQFYRRCTDF